MSSEVFIEVAGTSTQYPVPSQPGCLCALGTRYWVLFLLRRQSQAEDRNHSRAGDVHFRFRGIRQIERLAMLAAIHFGVRSPGFFNIAAGLFDHVSPVGPAF